MIPFFITEEGRGGEVTAHFYVAVVAAARAVEMTVDTLRVQ